MTLADRIGKVPSLFLSLFLAVAMLSGGCTSKYGTQATQVNHYPDCYAPIKELRDNEFAVQKGVAAGAVGGAILGALIGYAATGKASGAVAGAAVGGVAGGTAGGVYASQRQDQNDAARLAEYNARLDGGISEMNKASAAARLARQCYDRQFTVAASEFKAGHISREQFNSRYLEVTQGMEEAANILGQANQQSAEVLATYNRALDEEAKRQNVSSEQVRASAKAKKAKKPAASKAPATSQTPAASQTSEAAQLDRMAERTSTMEASVNTSREEERLLRERLAATHKQAQDLMS